MLDWIGLGGVVIPAIAIGVAYWLGRTQLVHQEAMLRSERERRQEAVQSMLADLALGLLLRVGGAAWILRMARKADNPFDAPEPWEIEPGLLWQEGILASVQAAEPRADDAMAVMAGLTSYNMFVRLQRGTHADGQDEPSSERIEQYKKGLAMQVHKLEGIRQLLQKLGADKSKAAQEWARWGPIRDDKGTLD